MRQTLAILLDAYRELNAKKLFWITMILSGLVVIAFGMVIVTPTGLKVAVWEIPNDFVNSNVFSVDTFYKFIFANIGIQFWLGWIATILGLITTAGMIPEFVTGGSIELTLSKPIGRLRLFLTKYAAGLLFVALQVLVFTTASFFVIGIRGGSWEPGLFLAVPIMVIFFSYLFCVSALIGLLTRSTIAALLLTILLWFFIWLLHSSEITLMSFRISQEVLVENREARVAQIDGDFAALEGPQDLGDDQESAGAEPSAPSGEGFVSKLKWAIEQSAESGPPDAARLEKRRRRLEDERDRLTEGLPRDREILGQLRTWHGIILGVKTVLPKTSETTELLERYIISAADLEDFISNSNNPGGSAERTPATGSLSQPEIQEEVGRRTQIAIRNRSEFWVIGTSLGFEFVLLGIGAWVFCRRDF